MPYRADNEAFTLPEGERGTVFTLFPLASKWNYDKGNMPKLDKQTQCADNQLFSCIIN